MTEPTARAQWQRACSSGACIEVAKVADRILIRDSKNPEAAPLSFSGKEWEEFVRAIKDDVFQF
ncbi:MAG TPA: DUF397 domain-containing protein [Actinoplanes sp.]|nr:DUF397 domain-containing protein [Actinoplanes sp.]